MAEKLKNVTNKLFSGDLTISKGNLWLIGGICLLAGVVYGLLLAPITHGVTIGSNNSVWGPKEDAEKTAEAAASAECNQRNFNEGIF